MTMQQQMNTMNNMTNMNNMNQMQMNHMNHMNNMNPMNQQMFNRNNQQNQQRYNFRPNQMQQNMQSIRSNNNSNTNNNQNKGPTKDTWISPFKNREQNINFFMYAYKCQPCPLRRNCQSKVTCPGWHHEGEKRRNPGEDPDFLYSEEPCPNVKPQGSNKWQPPSRCPDGDKCGYSHTLLEQMYHPNIYKTSMCINFTNPQGNKCQWGFYCTHAHGQEDIGNPNKKGSSTSNTDNSASKTDDNDKNTNTNNPSNNKISQPLNIMDKKKMDKRSRSQSAQSNLPNYQNNDMNTYSNGGNQNHLRSPQYGMMNPSHGVGHSHNLPSNQLPQPNMQYNSYNSPDGTNVSPNHSMNGVPPSRSMTSHRADFSPVPYTAKQFQKQNPPQFSL